MRAIGISGSPRKDGNTETLVRRCLEGLAKHGVDGEFVTLHFGDIHIPKIGNDEPLRVECQHFLDAIADDTTPRSDGRDALNVVKVLEAMEISLREGGRPVKTAEL